LFLDEPTLGLDPQTREHIWTYVRELKKTHDITVVLTTHYMDEADRLCNRIAIMDYGKIIALDTPAKLKETLEGDVITVKADNLDALSLVIAKKLGLNKTQKVNGTLEVTVRNGKSLMPRVMELATENKILLNRFCCVNRTSRTFFSIIQDGLFGLTLPENFMASLPCSGGR